MQIDKLQWDTDFFGIKIGRLDVVSDIDFNPTDFLEKAKDEGFDLVYIFKYHNALSWESVLKAGIEFKDVMLTMTKEFDSKEYSDTKSYLKNSLSADELKDVYKIAEETSIVSRFYYEPIIGAIKTKELYRKWIENALTGQYSDGIFIETYQGEVLGFHLIRTDIKNSTGYFTLTGVNPLKKRMGIGRKLWQQSFGYWAENSMISEIRSPFSLQNTESFNFHIKMGFQRLAEIKYIYHFRK